MKKGKHRPPRDEHDFYATEPRATIALLIDQADRLPAGCLVLEPACGDGQISMVLQRAGIIHDSRDLIDRGFGRFGVDFLTTTQTDGCQRLITNPPFNLAVEFLIHARETLHIPYVALLLKSTFWHAGERIELHERHPPSETLMLTWRLDFTREGSPEMECCWFIWHDGPPQPPRPLRKPTGAQIARFYPEGLPPWKKIHSTNRDLFHG